MSVNDVLASIRPCANGVFEFETTSTSTFPDPHAVHWLGGFDGSGTGRKAVLGMKKGFRHIAEVGALDASAVASTRVVTELVPQILAKNVDS